MTIGGISQEFGEDSGRMKRVCPFVHAPLEDCLLTNMDSQNIEEIINYCSGDFEQCEIYKKALARQGVNIGANGTPTSKWPSG